MPRVSTIVPAVVVPVVVVLTAGAYILTSLCLMKGSIRSKANKERLRERFPYPLTNIGHRGGSLLGPENTMYTFMRGVREGLCDMLELDVRASKDGQIVVCHDHGLVRTCGSAYAAVSISDIVVGPDPSETLPQSQRVIELEFKTHDTKAFEASSEVPVDDTTRLCLLSEVFEKLPSTPLHVDIKDAGKEFVTAVLDLIARYHRESITFVGSSNQPNQQFMNEYFASKGVETRKRYRVFGGPRDFFRTYLLFYTGLLPYSDVNFDVFSIPVFTSTMRSQAAVAFGSFYASVGAFLFTSPLLWCYLKSRGIAVIAWNFNDEADIVEALQYPLNGLMSDDPIKLHRLIDANKKLSRLDLLDS